MDRNKKALRILNNSSSCMRMGIDTTVLFICSDPKCYKRFNFNRDHSIIDHEAIIHLRQMQIPYQTLKLISRWPLTFVNRFCFQKLNFPQCILLSKRLHILVLKVFWLFHNDLSIQSCRAFTIAVPSSFELYLAIESSRWTTLWEHLCMFPKPFRNRKPIYITGNFLGIL